MQSDVKCFYYRQTKSEEDNIPKGILISVFHQVISLKIPLLQLNKIHYLNIHIQMYRLLKCDNPVDKILKSMGPTLQSLNKDHCMQTGCKHCNNYGQ